MPQPTVLISGAAKRLGGAIALAFAKRGCNLMIHYNHSEKQAKLLQASLSQYPVQCHIINAELSQPANLTAMINTTIERFGRLDHLVNNASVFYPTPVEAWKATQLQELLTVNYQSPKKLSELAAPYLTVNKGSITNLLDIYAHAGHTEHSFYVAAKAALKALTAVQAGQFAPLVRVNAVSPGAILWPDADNSSDEALFDTNQNENKISLLQQRIVAQSALKRLGKPEHIAATVVYLALDAGYTTGSIIRVDGGRRDFI